MKRPRPGIVTEVLPVGLVLGCVAGTLGLVLVMHQRAATVRRAAEASPVPAVVSTVVESVKPVSPAEKPRPEPAPPQVVVTPPPPRPPAEDPTKAALARIATQIAEQRRMGAQADRRAEALERARRAAVAESERWRTREALVKSQVDRLSEQATKLESTADTLARERDVLARERDAAKAALAKAQASGGGYAVLPHRGANGTWQRPVVIECRNGMAVLQPQGLNFTMLEMSPLMGPRSSPLVTAVARELIKTQEVTSPDGAPIIPYIYFIVRPDGVRPYYEARARLEPLGIAFGYELVDQDWPIEFPDVNTWDTGVPKRDPGHGADDRQFAWPADRPGGGGGGGGGGNLAGANPGGTPAGSSGGTGGATGGGDSRDPFLWPRRPVGDVAAAGDGDDGDVMPRGPGSSGGPGGRASIVPGVGGKPGVNGLVGGTNVAPLLEGFQRGTPGFGGNATGLSSSPPGRPGLDDGPGLPGLRGGTGSPAAGTGVVGGSGPARETGAGTGTGLADAGAGLRPVNPVILPGFEPSGGGSGGVSPSGSARQGATTALNGGPSGAAAAGRAAGGAPTGSPGQPGMAGTGSGTFPPAGSSPGGPGGTQAAAGTPPTGLAGAGITDAPQGIGVGLPGQKPGQGADWSGVDPELAAKAIAAGVRPDDLKALQKLGPGAAKLASRLGLDPKLVASLVGVGRGSGSGSPADGRVKIDPSQLEADESDDERPPAPPSGLRVTGAGGGSSGSPPTGVGQPSSSCDAQGGSGIGLGTPNLGTDHPSPSGLKATARPATPLLKPKSVDVPLELVVACGPDGVVLHPGGYRLSLTALKREKGLKRDLVTIVQNHAMIDPLVHPKPRLTFLVEAGGGATYAEARRQTVVSGIDWPVQIQVAGGPTPWNFGKERF